MKSNQNSPTELEKRYKTEKDPLIKERLHMILLLEDKYSCRDVAKICRTSKSKVSFWHIRFQKMGYEGLKDKSGRGRKPGLTEEQIKSLDEEISRPYKMANGYTRGWQTKDVYLLIKKKYGIKYSSRHVRRLLESLEFVVLVPRPRHKKRNQKEVDAFQQEFKKNARIWVKRG